MINLKILSTVLLPVLFSTILYAERNESLEVKSPDGDIVVNIIVGTNITWSAKHRGQSIIEPSSIALLLESGEILGEDLKIRSHETLEVNDEFEAINYKKAIVKDQYNQLCLDFRNDFGVTFRVYDDGVAYQFYTRKKGEIKILKEVANFNFPADYKAFIPYMWDYRDGEFFNHSFEAEYEETSISGFRKDSLAFLPLMVEADSGKKVLILEAELVNYPGMYLDMNQTGKGFKGVFAPYPLESRFGGYENMNYIPVRRADYIARTSGTRTFPWRVVIISEEDRELLENDMVQKLSAPSRIADESWIEPGQVAWDWWNDWNISHVDFRAGMNNPTYEYYIDFAAKNGIKYIIIDWGWSARMDLTDLNPDLDLKEVVEYGKKKNVGVIIWATWYAVTKQMDEVFPMYAEMGVKGFKIDFIDRDDQLAVTSLYEIAEKAARHHLLVDFHGVFKPTGLQRTYPNVLNYEGVKGLENMKWADYDAMRYDVLIPYIRMVAGPMDYTPGAMRNATRQNFRPIGSRPMSQGTRAHQMAMYVIFDGPLQMLADDPTTYTREQECTDFITGIPTTYDQTVALGGSVGDFVSIARRKGEVWYVAAMNSWESREISLDFSFLDEGSYEAVLIKDGINADRDATDYKKEVTEIHPGDKLKIQLSNGGGWVARIERKEN